MEIPESNSDTNSNTNTNLMSDNKDMDPQTSDQPATTFGERIDSIPDTPDYEPIDQYGLPMYRDHDEFGEWLDRYND